jgi:serralysin
MEVTGVEPSGDVYVDAVIAGIKWSGTALTYSFPSSASQFTGYAADGEPSDNFEAFNATQIASVKSAYAQIASFTNLTFGEVTGASAGTAVLRFGMSDMYDTAVGYLPDSADTGGDAWFNNSSGDYDNPVLGNYAWDTVMHEIGHTLGLMHPHESEPPMPLDQDFLAYTVMSYRSYQGPTLTQDTTTDSGNFRRRT